MTGLFPMLLGAMLVVVGVLAGGLADRLRGNHVRRPVTMRPDRTRRSDAAGFANCANDVIAAIVAVGYKRSIATDATWGCVSGEH